MQNFAHNMGDEVLSLPETDPEPMRACGHAAFKCVMSWLTQTNLLFRTMEYMDCINENLSVLAD